MCSIVEIAYENMDEKTPGSSKVDEVIHTVTFYPQTAHSGTSSFRKTAPDVHIKSAACTNSDLQSHHVCDNYTSVQKAIDPSERCNGGRKSTVLDRRPKSIESARLTKSKHRLTRKPKYTLLPYKRGQVKFCTESGNEIVRNRTSVMLNSELSAEKENKTNSDGYTVNASTEKLKTRGGTSRRFFKASFGKRRQFTLSMRGLTTTHMKLSHSKQLERNATVRIKQLHMNATDANDCSKSRIGMESAMECCTDDLSAISNIDTTFESLCEVAPYENTEVAVVSCDGDVENDIGSQNERSGECMEPDNFCSLSGVEECCPVAGISDMVDHSTASQVMSTSDSESCSDNTVTRSSLKHGTVCFTYF